MHAYLEVHLARLHLRCQAVPQGQAVGDADHVVLGQGPERADLGATLGSVPEATRWDK
jgi:hypothetical protein